MQPLALKHPASPRQWNWELTPKHSHRASPVSQWQLVRPTLKTWNEKVWSFLAHTTVKGGWWALWQPNSLPEPTFFASGKLQPTEGWLGHSEGLALEPHIPASMGTQLPQCLFHHGKLCLPQVRVTRDLHNHSPLLPSSPSHPWKCGCSCSCSCPRVLVYFHCAYVSGKSSHVRVPHSKTNVTILSSQWNGPLCHSHCRSIFN